MNDFSSMNLRTLIPLAVGGVLVATGCSPEGSAARKYCKTYKKCDEDGFDDEYESVGDCVKINKYENKLLTAEANNAEGPECKRAAKKAIGCYARQLTCDAFPGDDPSARDIEKYLDWAEEAYDECEDDYDEVEDACDYGGYSYSYSYNYF